MLEGRGIFERGIKEGGMSRSGLRKKFEFVGGVPFERSGRYISDVLSGIWGGEDTRIRRERSKQTRVIRFWWVVEVRFLEGSTR